MSRLKALLQRAREFARRRSAPTEDDTEYNGFLSYAGEFHALIIGLAAGFTAAVSGQPMILAGLFAIALGISGRKINVEFRGRHVVHEVKRESWYAIGGGLVAYVAMGGRLSNVLSSLLV